MGAIERRMDNLGPQDKEYEQLQELRRNHPDLLKELIWESGNPRWVLYGTHASGAGVVGCGLNKRN